MKWILPALILLCGCSDFGNQPKAERPTANLPKPLSQRNWVGSNRQGSCVIAASVDALRWEGQHAKAERLRQRYSGGQSYNDLKRIFDAEGIRYACTIGGDVTFLDRALATRRGAVVTINVHTNPYEFTTDDTGYHCVFLAHLDSKWAGILDNNFPEKIFWLKRNDFIRYWQASAAWAFVPVYSPTSPRVP